MPPDHSTDIAEISPTEFVRRWPNEAARSRVVLLDVREHDELARASLPFVCHIPMAEVPARSSELDPTAIIVVVCHGGMRSRKVAEFLATQGFPNVLSLAGGIDAWSREIDGTIPRY